MSQIQNKSSKNIQRLIIFRQSGENWSNLSRRIHKVKQRVNLPGNESDKNLIKQPFKMFDKGSNVKNVSFTMTILMRTNKIRKYIETAALL